MGTRSVVGFTEGEGWKGRYIYWDGYPTGVGKNLWALIKRDGVEKVLKTICHDYYGWSSIDLGTPALPDNDGRFVIVPGYGVAYTEVDGQSNSDQWVTSDEKGSWCEFAYILDEGSGAFSTWINDGSWKIIHVANIHNPVIPFDDIEAGAYAWELTHD